MSLAVIGCGRHTGHRLLGNSCGCRGEARDVVALRRILLPHGGAVTAGDEPRVEVRALGGMLVHAGYRGQPGDRRGGGRELDDGRAGVVGRFGERGLHGRDEAGFGRLVGRKFFGLLHHVERLNGFDVHKRRRGSGEKCARLRR